MITVTEIIVAPQPVDPRQAAYQEYRRKAREQWFKDHPQLTKEGMVDVEVKGD